MTRQFQEDKVFYWEVVNVPIDSAEVVDGKDIQSMIYLSRLS